MALYYDNANRSQRVQDLVNDIGAVQGFVVAIRNQMKQNEDRAYGYLKKVATAAGYSSPDDYVNNVLQLVPEGERTKFQKLRDQLTKENKDCGTALDVLGGVASLCVIAGGLLADKSLLFFGLARQVVAERVIAEAIASSVEGAAIAEKTLVNLLDLSLETGPEFLAAAEKTGVNLSETIIAGAAAGKTGATAAEEITVAVSNTIKVARVASKVLGVVGVVATIGLLVYEGIEGAKQKKHLEELTLEYSAKRFYAQYTEILLQRASGLEMDCMAMVLKEDTLNDLVKDGTITEEMKKKKMADQVNTTAEKLTAALTSVSDADVLQLTGDTDKHSWTDEDPSLEAMKQWMARQPK